MVTENRSYFFTAPRKQYYCNRKACLEKLGGIRNFVNPNKGQSMFRLGYYKCRNCNVYFPHSKIIGKKCPCCDDFLVLKPTRQTKHTKKCSECGEENDKLIRYLVESDDQTGVYKEINLCWNCLNKQDDR